MLIADDHAMRSGLVMAEGYDDIEVVAGDNGIDAVRNRTRRMC